MGFPWESPLFSWVIIQVFKCGARRISRSAREAIAHPRGSHGPIAKGKPGLGGPGGPWGPTLGPAIGGSGAAPVPGGAFSARDSSITSSPALGLCPPCRREARLWGVPYWLWAHLWVLL